MWIEIKEACKRWAFGVAAASLLVAVACSCSSRAGGSTGGVESPGATHAVRPDFTLVNFARTNLYAVYVSPHDSSGWEENVLGRDLLFEGEHVKIRFSPEEKAVLWDLRVEDESGNNAVWKNLNLREISKITLRRSEQVVTAEAE